MLTGMHPRDRPAFANRHVCTSGNRKNGAKWGDEERDREAAENKKVREREEKRDRQIER